jgi:tetratricopeptide (TPR) repeat protein
LLPATRAQAQEDPSLYADLQQARDAEALRIIQEAKKTLGNADSAATAYAAAAMPARYEFERGDWKTAMDLPVAQTKFAHADALTHYARALGAIRARLPASANDDIQALNALHQAIVDSKDSYWSTEVEVQRLTVAAWLASSRGRTEEALRLMRSAADLEDAHAKPAGAPARLLPARELLGELLLDMKQPAEALKELEASNRREPGRFRGYAGAARAALQSGDRTKVRHYYVKLVDMAGAGDARPDLTQARAFLAANP